MKKLSNIIVDCEASGPCIGAGDLIEFAAISECGREFKSEKFPPLFDRYDDGAYKSIGLTREEHLSYSGDFKSESLRFAEWLGKDRQCFWSDNVAFDWQWINWLFCYHNIKNPFGYSGRRIGDFYAGLNRDLSKHNKWKKYRITKHTHDPLDDVKGNMEAFKKIKTMI